MQDETAPPIPVKDVPAQPVQTPVASAQPVSPPNEPIKQPPAIKEEQVAVKAENPHPKQPSSMPIMPIIAAIFIFIVLAACTYFVFKGM